MCMNDASQQWQEKWEDLLLLLPQKEEKNSQNEVYYHWELSKKGINIEIVIELDKKGYCGIYYGCRTNKNNEVQLTSPTFDISKIKDDYFKNYWHKRNPSNSRKDVENVFLLDDGHTGGDKYWPFWIRLEEKYPIKETFIASQVIIESLKNQGWTFISTQ